MSNTNASEELVPELGDLITILSDLYTSTTGRIIYRDGALIRVRPSHVSDRAVDFPLDPETGLFQDSLGVTELLLHEKAKQPHYSRQLGVLPGESLQFYTVKGDLLSTGVVKAILSTDTEDAMELEDGRVLNFGFLGAPEPYSVIVPLTAVEEYSMNIENDGQEEVAEDLYAELPEIELPAALVVDIPKSELTYSDTIQREDMFISLLLDVPQSKQKNPRILRNIYRKTDLLLALKNSVVVRDETGTLVARAEPRTYTPNTMADVLALQPGPVASLLPVAAVKKVLYTDAEEEQGQREDVDVRSDVRSLLQAKDSAEASREGDAFLAYMSSLFSSIFPVFVPQGAAPHKWIPVDQDVLRSRIPPSRVQGLEPLGKSTAANASEFALTNDFVGRTVKDRTARLLAEDVLVHPQTGVRYQMAPADSGEVLDHIFLSPDLAVTRTAPRSSVLLWDIQASDASRTATSSFYTRLMARWDAQQLAGLMEDSVAAVIEKRVPAALQIAERSIVGALDAIGMRPFEFNSEVMDVLAKALVAGQAAWDTAMADLRKRAIAALATENIPVLSPISQDNPLWTEAVETQPEMAGALNALKAREPSLFDTHAARTSYMLSLANGTLLNVWYGLAANGDAAAIAAAADTYRAERRRMDRALAQVRQQEAALTAAPVLNDCKHVHLLESIRSIRDDARRFAMLQDFLTTYQNGSRGNWIICGLCDKNLLCRHELLLLHEFQHPGRSSALHKTLLLEFSGPVFEGAYICKNCGQKIADLEFDTHMEFDDEGRPLVGRTVVTDAVSEADVISAAVGAAVAAVGAETAALAGEEEERKIYNVVQTVLEYCGITPVEAQHQRIVKAVQEFLLERTPSEERYKVLVQQAAKLRRPPLPSYEVTRSTTMIGAIGALVTMELQTGDFAIPFPAHGCKLERGGFPLEESGNGALTYVACVIAGILRTDAPWTAVTWSKETSPIKRKASIFDSMQSILQKLLALPDAKGVSPAPLPTVTETYTNLLVAKRAQIAEAGIADDTRFVSADRLPAAFRPLPRVEHEAQEEAVPNSSNLQRDVKEGPLPDVMAYVARRQHDVLQETLQAVHAASRASAKALHILSDANPRSDAACCYQRLAVIGEQGAGMAAAADMGDATREEMNLLEASAQALRARDPAASANGTHLYVPWSAPLQRSEMPQAAESMYYRLFLKNCFLGEHTGLPHEYGLDWVCRHCKYACPPELEYLTGAELGSLDAKKFQKALEELELKRKELAVQSLEGRVNEESFHALEDAIHIRKTVIPYTYPGGTELLTLLESMRQELIKANLPESALKTWDQLRTDVPKLIGLPLSLARDNLFSKFVRDVEQGRKTLQEQMMARLGARPVQVLKNSVEAALEALDVLIQQKDPLQGARNVLTYLLTPLQQLATGYMNKKPPVKKWFPKASRTLESGLNSIWERHNTPIHSAVDALDKVSEEARQLVVQTLQRVTAWMGPWTRHWIEEFRPATGFTPDELAYLLKWSLIEVTRMAIDVGSAWYSGVASDVKQAAAKAFQNFFISAMKTAKDAIEKTQLTPEQIQNIMLVRQEKEKTEFIKKFDKLNKSDRALELMKKKYGLGDWAAISGKDPAFLERSREQYAAMGLLSDFGGETGLDGAAATAATAAPRVEVQDTNDHRVGQDEDD